MRMAVRHLNIHTFGKRILTYMQSRKSSPFLFTALTLCGEFHGAREVENTGALKRVKNSLQSSTHCITYSLQNSNYHRQRNPSEKCKTACSLSIFKMLEPRASFREMNNSKRREMLHTSSSSSSAIILDMSFRFQPARCFDIPTNPTTFSVHPIVARSIIRPLAPSTEQPRT